MQVKLDKEEVRGWLLECQDILAREEDTYINPDSRSNDYFYAFAAVGKKIKKVKMYIRMIDKTHCECVTLTEDDMGFIDDIIGE